MLTEDDTLYFVKGEELVKVDEEVNTFVVSAYGDSIAYIKDIENHVGDLYLYNVAKENATKVDSEVYNECITLSPDGKTVAYVGNCEMEYDSWWGYYEVMSGDLYVSKNGKEAEKLYKDAAPIAISDDAKYVYYIGDVSDNAKFYMNDEKIISDSNEGMDLYFNDDLSELLYYTDGETRLFTAAKKTDVKVKNAKLYGVVVPEDVIIGTFMDNVYYVGIDTFDKSVLNLDFSYYFMFDKGEETEKVCSGVSDFVMSEDGKSILYAEDDELLYVKDVTKSREERFLVRI